MHRTLLTVLALLLALPAFSAGYVSDTNFQPTGTATSATTSCDLDTGSEVNPALVTIVGFGDTTATINSVVATAGSMVLLATAPDPLSGTHTLAAYAITGVSGLQEVDVTLAAPAEVWCMSVLLNDVDQATPLRDFGVNNGNTNSSTPIAASADSAVSDLVLSVASRNEASVVMTADVGSSIESHTASDFLGAVQLAGSAPSATVSWSTASAASVQSGTMILSFQSPTGGGGVSPVSTLQGLEKGFGPHKSQQLGGMLE